MTVIAFTVPGIPISQGSKRHVGNGRMIESAKGLKPWRRTVAAVAYEAVIAYRNGWQPLGKSAVHVHLVFTFPRPAYHYGTGRNGGVVKDRYVNALHTTKPDLDKCVRAIGDAITGVLIADDSQIVGLTALKKYGDPGVDITVTTIEELTA